MKGLNDFPKDEIPPLFIHYLFDGMVGIGTFLAAVAVAFWVYIRYRQQSSIYRLLLRLIVAGGPLSILAIECGWIYAEVGRQPWILRGYMKTAEGATTSGQVGLMLVLFFLLYAVLGFTCARVLLRLFRNQPAEKELAYMEGSEIS